MSTGAVHGYLVCRRLTDGVTDKLTFRPGKLGFLYVRDRGTGRGKLIYLHPAENDTVTYQAGEAGYLINVDRDRLLSLPGLYAAAAFFRNYRPSRSIEIVLTQNDVDPEPVFLMIMDHVEANEDDHALAVSACATLLLYLRQIIKYRYPFDAFAQPHRLSARFMEMVEQNYRRRANVAFYAQQLSISEDYLTRVCQQEFGRSAKDAIQSRRFEEAQHLLRTTSYRIKEISAKLGFESADYFSRAFKRYCGQNPEDYRKKTE